jgi:hypothetical protein
LQQIGRERALSLPCLNSRERQSFLLAEQLHFSGVLATIVAGLIIGNRGPSGVLSEHGREAVQASWEYAASLRIRWCFC